ncbi:putative serine/threonine protein kinase [Blattamonas nauphoetae]|uniref:non-specific serine/threonine protein kinase n=1 Tax=Blattamonas nauphoetae TaxID=2049346 RepID=A0ABQ9XMI7_9EUKA|nr:putative serine/threonine protein kinase [Blattamonas nauphoetae]
MSNAVGHESSYYKIKLIGEGSFGRVFKGRKKGTGHLLALKYIGKQKRTQRETQALLGEVEVMRKLQHENVIQFVDCFDTEDEFVVVTVFAQSDLSKLLADDKHFSEGEIQWIIRQLASALKYLHEMNIIHRDLKPQNILIDSTGSIKLCDFGFARILDEKTTKMGSIKGTPLYMAPEIALERKYDWRSDLWSLGVLLYELHCGHVPFEAENYIELLHKLQNDEVNYLPQMSDLFVDFLKGLLQKDPNRRFTWPNLLNHPFLTEASSEQHNFVRFNAGTKPIFTYHNLDDYIPLSVLDLQMKDPTLVGQQDRILKNRRLELEQFIDQKKSGKDSTRPDPNALFNENNAQDVGGGQAGFLPDLFRPTDDPTSVFSESSEETEESEESDQNKDKLDDLNGNSREEINIEPVPDESIPIPSETYQKTTDELEPLQKQDSREPEPKIPTEEKDDISGPGTKVKGKKKKGKRRESDTVKPKVERRLSQPRKTEKTLASTAKAKPKAKKTITGTTTKPLTKPKIVKKKKSEPGDLVKAKPVKKKKKGAKRLPKPLPEEIITSPASIAVVATPRADLPSLTESAHDSHHVISNRKLASLHSSFTQLQLKDDIFELFDEEIPLDFFEEIDQAEKDLDAEMQHEDTEQSTSKEEDSEGGQAEAELWLTLDQSNILQADSLISHLSPAVATIDPQGSLPLLLPIATDPPTSPLEKRADNTQMSDSGESYGLLELFEIPEDVVKMPEQKIYSSLTEMSGSGTTDLTGETSSTHVPTPTEQSKDDDNQSSLIMSTSTEPTELVESSDSDSLGGGKKPKKKAKTDNSETDWSSSGETEPTVKVEAEGAEEKAKDEASDSEDGSDETEPTVRIDEEESKDGEKKAEDEKERSDKPAPITEKEDDEEEEEWESDAPLFGKKISHKHPLPPLPTLRNTSNSFTFSDEYIQEGTKKSKAKKGVRSVNAVSILQAEILDDEEEEEDEEERSETVKSKKHSENQIPEATKKKEEQEESEKHEKDQSEQDISEKEETIESARSSKHDQSEKKDELVVELSIPPVEATSESASHKSTPKTPPVATPVESSSYETATEHSSKQISRCHSHTLLPVLRKKRLSLHPNSGSKITLETLKSKPRFIEPLNITQIRLQQGSSNHPEYVVSARGRLYHNKKVEKALWEDWDSTSDQAQPDPKKPASTHSRQHSEKAEEEQYGEDDWEWEEEESQEAGETSEKSINKTPNGDETPDVDTERRNNADTSDSGADDHKNAISNDGQAWDDDATTASFSSGMDNDLSTHSESELSHLSDDLEGVEEQEQQSTQNEERPLLIKICEPILHKPIVKERVDTPEAQHPSLTRSHETLDGRDTLKSDDSSKLETEEMAEIIRMRSPNLPSRQDPAGSTMSQCTAMRALHSRRATESYIPYTPRALLPTKLPKELLVLSHRILWEVKSKYSLGQHLDDEGSGSPRSSMPLFSALLPSMKEVDTIITETFHVALPLGDSARDVVTKLVGAFNTILKSDMITELDAFLCVFIVFCLLMRNGVVALPPIFFSRTRPDPLLPTPPNLIPLLLYDGRETPNSPTSLSSEGSNADDDSQETASEDGERLKFPNLNRRLMSMPIPACYPLFGTLEAALSFAGMPFETRWSDTPFFLNTLPPFVSIIRPTLNSLNPVAPNVQRLSFPMYQSHTVSFEPSSQVPPKNPVTLTFNTISPSPVSPTPPIPTWLSSRWGVYRWLPIPEAVPLFVDLVGLCSMRGCTISVPHLDDSVVMFSYTVDEMFESLISARNKTISRDSRGTSVNMLQFQDHSETESFTHTAHSGLASIRSNDVHVLPTFERLSTIDWFSSANVFITAVHGVTNTVRTIGAAARGIYSSIIGSFWNGTFKPGWIYNTDERLERGENVYEEDGWLMSLLYAAEVFFHNFFTCSCGTTKKHQGQASFNPRNDQSSTTFLRWHHILSFAFPTLSFCPNCAVLPRAVPTHILFASRMTHHSLSHQFKSNPEGFVSPIRETRVGGVAAPSSLPSEETVLRQYTALVGDLQRASLDFICALVDCLESLSLSSSISSQAQDLFVSRTLAFTPLSHQCTSLMGKPFTDAHVSLQQIPANLIQHLTRETIPLVGTLLFGGSQRWNLPHSSTQLFCVLHGVGTCNCVREWKSTLKRRMFNDDYRSVYRYQGGKNVKTSEADTEARQDQLTVLIPTYESSQSGRGNSAFPMGDVSNSFQDVVAAHITEVQDSHHTNILARTYQNMKNHQTLIQSTTPIPLLPSNRTLDGVTKVCASLHTLFASSIFPAFSPLAEDPDIIFGGEVRGVWEKEQQTMRKSEERRKKQDERPGSNIDQNLPAFSDNPPVPHSYSSSRQGCKTNLPVVDAYIKSICEDTSKRTRSKQKTSESQAFTRLASMLNSELFLPCTAPHEKEVDQDNIVTKSKMQIQNNTIDPSLIVTPDDTDYPLLPPIISFTVESFVYFLHTTNTMNQSSPGFGFAHAVLLQIIRQLLWILKHAVSFAVLSIPYPGYPSLPSITSLTEILGAIMIVPISFIKGRALHHNGAISIQVLLHYLEDSCAIDTIIKQIQIPTNPSTDSKRQNLSGIGKFSTNVADPQAESLLNSQQANTPRALDLDDPTMTSDTAHSPFLVLVASLVDQELESLTVFTSLNERTNQDGDLPVPNPDPESDLASRHSFLRQSRQKRGTDPKVSGFHITEHHIQLVIALYGVLHVVSTGGDYLPHLMRDASADARALNKGSPNTISESRETFAPQGTKRSLGMIKISTAQSMNNARKPVSPILTRLRFVMARLSLNCLLDMPFISFSPDSSGDQLLLQPEMSDEPHIDILEDEPLEAAVPIPPLKIIQVSQPTGGRPSGLSRATGPVSAKLENGSIISSFETTNKSTRLSIFCLPAHMLRLTSVLSLVIPHICPLSPCSSALQYRQRAGQIQHSPIPFITGLTKQLPIWNPRQSLAVFAEDFRRQVTDIQQLESYSSFRVGQFAEDYLEYSLLLPFGELDPQAPDRVRNSFGEEKTRTSSTHLQFLGGPVRSHTEHIFRFGLPFHPTLAKLKDATAITAKDEDGEYDGEEDNDASEVTIEPVSVIVSTWEHLVAYLSGVLFSHYQMSLSALICGFFAFSEAMCFSSAEVTGDLSTSLPSADQNSIVSSSAKEQKKIPDSWGESKNPRILIERRDSTTLYPQQLLSRGMAGGYENIYRIRANWWIQRVPNIYSSSLQQRPDPRLSATHFSKSKTRVSTDIESVVITQPNTHDVSRAMQRWAWSGSLSQMPILPIWGAATNMFPLPNKPTDQELCTYTSPQIVSDSHRKIKDKPQIVMERCIHALQVGQADLLSLYRFLAQSPTLCRQIQAELDDIHNLVATTGTVNLNMCPRLVSLPFIQLSSFLEQSSNQGGTNAQHSSARQYYPQNLPRPDLYLRSDQKLSKVSALLNEKGPMHKEIYPHHISVPPNIAPVDMVLQATQTSPLILKGGNFAQNASSLEIGPDRYLFQEIPLEGGAVPLSLSLQRTGLIVQTSPDSFKNSVFPTHLSDTASPVWMVDLLVWAAHAIASPPELSYGFGNGVSPLNLPSAVSEGIGESPLVYALSFLSRISREVFIHVLDGAAALEPTTSNPTKDPSPTNNKSQPLSRRGYHQSTPSDSHKQFQKPIDGSIQLSQQDDTDQIFYLLNVRPCIPRPPNTIALNNTTRLLVDVLGSHFPYVGSNQTGLKLDTPFTPTESSFYQQKLCLTSNSVKPQVDLMNQNPFSFSVALLTHLIHHLHLLDSILSLIDPVQFVLPPSPLTYTVALPHCAMNTSAYQTHKSGDGKASKGNQGFESTKSVSSSSGTPIFTFQSANRRTRFEILTIKSLFCIIQTLTSIFNSSSVLARPSIKYLTEITQPINMENNRYNSLKKGSSSLSGSYQSNARDAAIQSTLFFDLIEPYWPSALKPLLDHNFRAFDVMSTLAAPDLGGSLKQSDSASTAIPHRSFSRKNREDMALLWPSLISQVGAMLFAPLDLQNFSVLIDQISTFDFEHTANPQVLSPRQPHMSPTSTPLFGSADKPRHKTKPTQLSPLLQSDDLLDGTDSRTNQSQMRKYKHSITSVSRAVTQHFSQAVARSHILQADTLATKLADFSFAKALEVSGSSFAYTFDTTLSSPFEMTSLRTIPFATSTRKSESSLLPYAIQLKGTLFLTGVLSLTQFEILDTLTWVMMPLLGQSPTLLSIFAPMKNALFDTCMFLASLYLDQIEETIFHVPPIDLILPASRNPFSVSVLQQDKQPFFPPTPTESSKHPSHPHFSYVLSVPRAQTQSNSSPLFAVPTPPFSGAASPLMMHPPSFQIQYRLANLLARLFGLLEGLARSDRSILEEFAGIQSIAQLLILLSSVQNYTPSMCIFNTILPFCAVTLRSAALSFLVTLSEENSTMREYLQNLVQIQ